MARPDVGVSGGGEEGGGVVNGAGVAVQPSGEPVGVAVGEFVEQRGSGVDQVEPLGGGDGGDQGGGTGAPPPTQLGVTSPWQGGGTGDTVGVGAATTSGSDRGVWGGRTGSLCSTAGEHATSNPRPSSAVIPPMVIKPTTATAPTVASAAVWSR